MLDHLQWNSLEMCRNIVKVTMLYKITHNLVDINTDLYISPQTPLTRRSHSLQYQTFSTSTDYFKFSFFPRTVVLRIALQSDIVSASLDQFKSLIQTQLNFTLIIKRWDQDPSIIFCFLYDSVKAVHITVWVCHLCRLSADTITH